MIKLGITGGIGSGKSLVCKVFSTFGIPVFNADIEARKAMNSDAELKNELIKTFGPDIYAGSEINKAKMAQLVFNDANTRQQVNNIIHPAVRRIFLAWVSKHKDYPLLIQEAAILFESGAYKLLDKSMVVYAPEEIRIQRVIQRDDHSRERVKKIMQQQMPEDEKLKRADFILNNYNDYMIIPQVLTIMANLGFPRQ